MPTNIYQQRALFTQSQINILYTMVNLGSPKMITLDPALYPADSEGFKIVPAGSLIIAGNGAATPAGTTIPYGRVFGASRVVGTQNSTTINVLNAQSFKVGDVVFKATGINGAPTQLVAITAIATNVVPNTVTFATAQSVTDGDFLFIFPATFVDDCIGLTVAPHDIGRDPNDVAGYLLAAVYRDRLPFMHSSIRQQLPGIVLCP